MRKIRTFLFGDILERKELFRFEGISSNGDSEVIRK